MVKLYYASYFMTFMIVGEEQDRIEKFHRFR
jgi:hypothetical protein